MKLYTVIFVLFLVIVATAMLQMAIFSRLTLLHGTADIVLLTLIAWGVQENGPDMWPWTILAGTIISFVSALPFFVPILGYVTVMGITRLIQRRIWQTPLLAMLLVTLLGTLVFHTLSTIALILNDTPIEFKLAWNQVIMPSLLINLILAMPVYAINQSIKDQITPLSTQE